MESFTIVLVSNASAQLVPGNILRSFAIFLPEQLNLDGQWEVSIPEMSYPSMYQNVTEGKLTFFDKKPSRLSELYYLEPGFTLPLPIFLKLWTFSFKKDTITAKTVSKLKCLEEHKKLRFTLQMNDLVSHSLVRIWDEFSEVMLSMNLG